MGALSKHSAMDLTSGFEIWAKLLSYFNSKRREMQQNNLSVGELEEIPECSCGAMAKCTCNVVKKVLEMEQNNKLLSHGTELRL